MSYLQVVSKIISKSVRHSAQMIKDFLALCYFQPYCLIFVSLCWLSTSWLQAKCFSVQPSYSINEYILTSSLKRGDKPEKSPCNINMWHRQRKGNRCMSGSKKIDIVFMKVKWFVDSIFRIAVSTYHQSLDQFSSPSLFLSGLCLEPPEELLNKNH